MTTEAITPNDEDIAVCDHQRQLDHIDEICHRIGAVLDQLEPYLPRLAAMLNPGGAMRSYFGKRRAPDAVPVSEAAPVSVGEAPADSGPVGA